MSEAPEHIFLSHQFLEILQQFSKLEIYGYREAERKKFDFACDLIKDWNRVLVGQTLWKHNEGTDKDIRSMLTEPNSDIWAYVARDTVKNRATLHEIVKDFHNSMYRDQMFKLKVFWIPQDFDADIEEGRETIRNILKETIVNDILFNIIFGRITAGDISYFLNLSGLSGLDLTLLYSIATKEFISYQHLSKELGRSSATVRNRVLQLIGTGFLSKRIMHSFFSVSLKGRVFLELLRRFELETNEEYQAPKLSDELNYILRMLNIEATPKELTNKIEWIYETNDILNAMIHHHNEPISSLPSLDSFRTYAQLVREIQNAKIYWNIDFKKPIHFEIDKFENDPKITIIR